MREPRCIDAFVLRDMAIDSMESNPHVNKAIARNHRLEHEHFLRLIALCPTIEAEPVKHGRWVNDGFRWFCNRCSHNALADYDTGSEVLSKVCPNCGAKMDGGADHA